MKQIKIIAMLMMLMLTACNDDFLNVDPLDTGNSFFTFSGVNTLLSAKPFNSIITSSIKYKTLVPFSRCPT